MTTVDIQELEEEVSEPIDHDDQGEAITIARHGRAAAQIVSAAIPPRLPAMVAEGSVRPGVGRRYLPTPIKLRGEGPGAAHCVAEGRR